MTTALYNGETMHARLDPLQHSFRYSVQGLVIDLDKVDALSNRSLIFKYNKFAPLSLHDRDYIQEDSRPILVKLKELLRSRGYLGEISRVILITTPRFFGYVFNPVSFYYCYDGNGDIRCHVAEINNTYGERHIYVCGTPDNIAEIRQGGHYYNFKKEFFVSPFNKVEGEYRVQFTPITEEFYVGFNIYKDQQSIFVSNLKGKLRSINNFGLMSFTLIRPFHLTMTMLRILYQAQILRFIRKLPMLYKPDPVSSHTQTLRRKR